MLARLRARGLAANSSTFLARRGCATAEDVHLTPDHDDRASFPLALARLSRRLTSGLRSHAHTPAPRPETAIMMNGHVGPTSNAVAVDGGDVRQEEPSVNTNGSSSSNGLPVNGYAQ